MKAQIILCMLGFSSIAYAQQSIYSRHNQQLPTNAVIQENTLQRTFEHLDKSKIETGVLLDAAVEFADLKKYNGILTDSSSTNAKIIGDIYNTLVMGKVSENKGNLMSPADFQNLWFGTQATDVLPVAGVYFRYNELSEANHWYFKNQQLSPVGRTADISTTTLSISPDNQLRDVYTNGVWQNPYDIHTVFAMAPIANSHNKLNFKVIFPQDLFQSNDGNKIAELAVKFSENDTFKVVQYGQEMTVNYPAVGNYQWTYRLTLNDGSVLYSQHPFNITSDLGKYVNTDDTTSRGHTPYRKVELENFQYFIPFPPMVQNRPKLTLYIRYRQGQSQITRPFIVAEGFDAGHITAPRKEGGDNTIEGFLDNLTGDLYYALKNYDIIYVDWGIGTDYIESNAELLKKAIRWVNQNKVGNEKNVVLGQSMGGLVARYALKDMEDQGENHDTKLYISHDAPHLGANTPLGLQYMMKNISKTFLKSPIVAGINYIVSPIVHGVPVSEIFSVADTPASRQMLINYVDKYGNIDNSKHNEWQAKLRAKGYPQQTRNVAISNGSECGTDQSVQQLLSMHHVSRGVFVDFIGAFIGGLMLDPGQVILSLLPGRSRYHYDFEVSPMLNLNENKNLYNGKIVYKKKILWFIDSQNTLLEGSYNQPANVFPIDKYGGGRYKFPKESMPNFIKNHLKVSDFNFVPTPSAIDLDFGNRTLTDVDYQNSYAYSQYNNRTPFHNFVVERFGASDENRFHTSFSPRNREFIINQLSDNPTLQNTVLESENLCAKNIEIKGKTPICSDEKNIIFNTGIANYIHWTVTKGAHLIDIVGPTNQREIKFNTKPNANGLVEFSVTLWNNGMVNSTTKKIWVGKPQVDYELTHQGIRVRYNLVSKVPEASLEDQGIINTSCKINYANGYRGNVKNCQSGVYRGDTCNWLVIKETKVANSCGEYTFSTAIEPRLEDDLCNLCDDYTISWVRDNTYRFIDDCPYNEHNPRNDNPQVRNKNSRNASTLNNRNSHHTIELANAMGQTVLTTSQDTFDISHLPAGAYYARVIKNGQVVHTQVLRKQ